MSDIKNISALIEDQFPDFYREEGPVFVDFVSEYYKWMEQSTDRINKLLNPENATVAVVYGNTTIVGYQTEFLSEFSPGDRIAICRNDTDYEMFTISTITDGLLLTLTTDKLPQFALTNAIYGNVHSKPNPGYYVRRTTDIVDIDKTSSEFLVFFKETYLKNIQIDTVTDIRTVIKNSLDIYRSKGTPRSVDLLFRETFGVNADVYYPSVDLFRPSSGKWVLPKYLELSVSELNTKLEGKQIEGIKSSATAFCDAIVRKQIAGRFVDVAYISAISGNFETNEKIKLSDGTTDIESASFVVGSLNFLSVAGGGSGYAIGDIIDFESDFGRQGKARVVSVANGVTGLTANLFDGGYGYTANAELVVSEKIIRIENVQRSATHVDHFDDFETITQPMANITYSAATAELSLNDDIFTYYGNGSVDGTGTILKIEAINSTVGEFRTSILSGNLNYSTFYTTANAASATKDVFEDTTVTANVTDTFANVILIVNSISGTFTSDEHIIDSLVGSGKFNVLTGVDGSNGTILLTNVTSGFEVGSTITGSTSNATATIDKINLDLAVHSITPNTTELFTTGNNYIYGARSNGTLTIVSTGDGFSLSLSNTLDYEETIIYNNDLLADYLTVDLANVAYGFPADPAGNLTSNTIENLLTNASANVGKIGSVVSFSAGNTYSRVPVVKIIDHLVWPYRKNDGYTFTIANSTSDYAVGDVVTQTSTNFRGLVQAANTTVLSVQRMRYADDEQPIVTINSTSTLVATGSGAEANLTSFIFSANTLHLGNDIDMSITITAGNGIVTELGVTDSGFGYIDGEAVTGGSITGLVNSTTHGTGSGFYASQDGFLSDIKKLQDGEYWQTHSYEIRAAVTLDKYEDMLKQVLHVAGTVFFGNLVHTTTSNTEVTAVINIGSNTVTTS